MHLHHTLVAVLSCRDVQGRVPVDVHGVQVTLCCQQDLSYVNTARKSSPVQTNVFLLEGKKRERRLFKTPWLWGFLPQLCTCSVQCVAAIPTLLWLAGNARVDRETSEQPNREFSLHPPLHTKNGEVAHKAIHHLPYTHTDSSSVSEPQTNLDQSRKEVTDMNKHPGKGWMLSFPSSNSQKSHCASQGCKIK